MFTSEKIAYRTAYQYITGEMSDKEHARRKIYTAMKEVHTARNSAVGDKWDEVYREELLNRYFDLKHTEYLIYRGWVRKAKAHIEAVAETWNLTF